MLHELVRISGSYYLAKPHLLHPIRQRQRRPPVFIHRRAEDDNRVGPPSIVGRAEEKHLRKRQGDGRNPAVSRLQVKL